MFSSDALGLTRCSVQALQDHDSVINVIDPVVAGTEKFSGVARKACACEVREYE